MNSTQKKYLNPLFFIFWETQNMFSGMSKPLFSYFMKVTWHDVTLVFQLIVTHTVVSYSMASELFPHYHTYLII